MGNCELNPKGGGLEMFPLFLSCIFLTQVEMESTLLDLFQKVPNELVVFKYSDCNGQGAACEGEGNHRCRVRNDSEPCRFAWLRDPV